MSKRGIVETTSGLIGVTSTTVLGFRGARNFLQLHNPSPSGGASIAFTFALNDKSVPTLTTNNITGFTGGAIVLAPGGSATYSEYTPTNAIVMVASQANAPVTIFFSTGGTGV